MRSFLRSLLSFLLTLDLAVAATAPAVVSPVEPTAKTADVYLFAFFRNEKDGLHLATSPDGLHWEALNGDRSFLKPQVSADKLMRDPTLQQGPDGTFHLLWTDSWTGKSIGYANSRDLVHWSEQVELPVMASEPTTKMSWAPEMRFDPQSQEWLIYWSSTVGTTPGQRTYATTTKDFKTFTPAKLFFDPGFGEIDASILADDNSKFLMFYKHGGQGIQIATADKLQGPYQNTDTMFAFPGTDQWEAPWPMKIGGDYVVFVDHFRSSARMGAWRSHDLKTWEDITAQTTGLRGVSHGSIIKVSQDIVDRIRVATAVSAAPTASAAPAPANSAPAAATSLAAPRPPATSGTAAPAIPKAPISGDKTIDVYLIGGQSNATGQGYLRNLPEGFKIDTRVLIFNSGRPHLNSGADPNTWLPLRQASESPDRFGPELGFGNRIQELFPERKTAIIKHAHSGTNLYAQWNPGADANDKSHWGDQFSTFVDTVEKGLQGLRDLGYEPVIRGMLWHQGENDANGGAPSENYAANLTHFIARVREQFHAPDLLFAYAYVLTSDKVPGYSGRSLVQKAEYDIDQNSGSPLAVKGAFVVKSDDLGYRAEDAGMTSSLANDFLHIGTTGQLEMGKRMADGMKARLPAK